MFKGSREYWNQYIQILNVWYGYIEKYIKQKKFLDIWMNYLVNGFTFPL